MLDKDDSLLANKLQALMPGMETQVCGKQKQVVVLIVRPLNRINATAVSLERGTCGYTGSKSL